MLLTWLLLPLITHAQAAPALQQMLFAVVINGKQTGTVVYALESTDNSIYLPINRLAQWQLKHDNAPSITYNGVRYINLRTLPGITYQLNTSTLTLYIHAPATAFNSNIIDINTNNQPTPSKPSFGSFFNYDLSLMHNNFDDSNEKQTQVGGVGEIGIFNRYGVGLGEFVAESNRVGQKFVRLDTTWTMDQPENMASWRLGDAITTAGSWSGAVRFGGIQYATNFGTQPGFITNPLPSIAGEATVPTLADFIVNNATISQQSFAPGPYTVQGLPVVTGAGDVVVVSRDILGRETVYQVPYYTSLQLLKPGLNDYSYSIGFARDNFGIDSNDYGRFVSTANFRHGFTDHLTGEVHAEVVSNLQDVGLGSNYQLGNLGVITTAIAGSHSKLGTGGLALLGLERRAEPFSINTNIEMTTNDFTRLGIQPGDRAPRLTSQTFIGYSNKKIGALGIGYIVQDNRNNQSNDELVTASYSRNITHHLSIIIAGLVNTHISRQSRVFAQLNWYLGGDRTASINSNLQRAASSLGAQIYKQLPDGPGYGYQLAAATGETTTYNAALGYQTESGTYTAQINGNDGNRDYEINASGGIVYMHRDVFLSRQIDESFAVASVPGFANVAVYEDGHYMGTTNSRGNLLIPGLVPYESNPIHFDVKDLPLNTTVETDEMNAIPYFRSGVLVKFPVKQIRSAIVKIVQNDGTPIPQAANMIINNQSELLLINSNGEAYLTNLQKQNTVTINWNNQQCRFDLLFPDTSNPLPNLGTIVCNRSH